MTVVVSTTGAAVHAPPGRWVFQAPTGRETRRGRPWRGAWPYVSGPGGAALAEAGLGAGPGASDARGAGDQGGLVAGLH